MTAELVAERNTFNFESASLSATNPRRTIGLLIYSEIFSELVSFFCLFAECFAFLRPKQLLASLAAGLALNNYFSLEVREQLRVRVVTFNSKAELEKVKFLAYAPQRSNHHPRHLLSSPTSRPRRIAGPVCPLARTPVP